jgi:hypothetical protein
MRVFFTALLAFVVLTACAPAPVVPTPTATVAPAPTIAPSPQPTAPVINLPPLATTTPVTMTDNTLIVYLKSGGFAGINEILTVYKDGKLELVETRQNLRREANVDPTRLAKLQELIAKPEYNNLQTAYQAMGADLFVYRITTRTNDGKTRTVMTMDAATHPDILTQVISELNTLRAIIK